MTFLIGFILFIFASVFSFYIPGRLIIDALKVKESEVITFILSWILGIALFILAVYGLSYINLSIFYLGILLVCAIIYVFKKRPLIPSFKIDIPLILIIIAGSVLFSSLMVTSGLMTDKGMQFYGVNAIDGFTHFAYIHNLLNHFPPTHPGVASLPLHGYHYFYDLLLSKFIQFYGFGVADLYFRFFPILTTLLYGGSFYLAAKLFSNNRIKIATILFFAYFSQGFAFFIPIIFKTTQLYQLSQPIALVVNPSIILSVSLLLTGLYLIPKIINNEKLIIATAIILGTISQIKVYSGIIGIISLGVFALYALITEKNKKEIFIRYFVTGLITGFITAVTYLPNNWGAATLVFAPLLFYEHYMQQEFYQPLFWEIKRQIFLEHNNISRLTLLYIQSFLLFWILGLGLRLAILLKASQIFKSKFWKNGSNVLFIPVYLVPFIIGSLFIQSISVFDIIQFYWILLILLSVSAGLVWGDFIQRSSGIIRYGVVILLIGFSTVSLFVYFQNKNENPYIISHDELRVYDHIGETVPINTFVVVLLEGQVDGETNEVKVQINRAPIVAGMSGVSTYREWEVTQFHLEDEYTKRDEKLNQLFHAVHSCDGEKIVANMQSIGSKYLVTTYNDQCLATSSALLNRSATAKNLDFYILK